MAAAIGAHFARPGAKVVAVMGDGSFGMTVGELETIVRHQRAAHDGRDLQRGLRLDQGRAEDRASASATSRSTSASPIMPPVAAAFGVKSWRVEDPAALQATLRAAIAAGGPTLVDVVCQPLQEARAPVSEWIA